MEKATPAARTLVHTRAQAVARARELGLLVA
jgi:ATP/maltotriose-dependent transcriptional regulator MalT